jgi:hypothetical protein
MLERAWAQVKPIPRKQVGYRHDLAQTLDETRLEQELEDMGM